MEIKNINIVLPNKIIHGDVEISQGKIVAIKQNIGLEEDPSLNYLIPGLIDLHTHGAFGIDVMDGHSFDKMSESVLQEGTTSFLATTMTAPIEVIKKAIDNVNNDSSNFANVIGIHLEGPFISRFAKGAQKEDYIIDPSIKIMRLLNENKNIKKITIAPEIKGALEVIRYCYENGIIVSLGHSVATYQEVIDAIEIGASGTTHTFNAMREFSHREAGIIGASLMSDKLVCELIADGIHVNKEAIQLLYKNKKREGIVLVTDSLRAKYLSDGVYDLGGQQVSVKGLEATLPGGKLAGSILRMNIAVKNMMKICDIPLYDAVYMASTNPAKELKLSSKGSIEVGKDADLVIVDKDLNVLRTIVAGIIKYEVK